MIESLILGVSLTRRKAMLTAERVCELLSYDADTGVLRWRVTCKGKHHAGDVAGTRHVTGYLSIGVGGRKYYAHRVAWAVTHGAWPFAHIDHMNGDPADNRLGNLRDVSRSINQQNRRRADRDNPCGLLGASRCKRSGRWIAQIDSRFLGRYDSPEAAHAAYVVAKRQLHEGNTL